jgi:hypothetical protein
MSYTINKTDGTAITTIADGQIDQGTTDITLIGRNYSGFGEYLNENLVKILENFASSSQPSHPLTGQLWYDVSQGRIKVYSGTSWDSVGTAILASTRPLTVGAGAFWYNTNDNQLYFYDGSKDFLIGPYYTSAQGQSGYQIVTVQDSSKRDRTVVQSYISSTLVGIYSAVEFTPRVSIPGFTGTVIKVGFNPALSDFKWRGTSANADQLGFVDATEYARKNQATTFTEQMTVQTNQGIRFGDGPQGSLQVEGAGDVVLRNVANDRKLILRYTTGNLPSNAIEVQPVDAGTDLMNLFPSNPDSLVTVGGNLTIVGNLTVEGTTTVVESSTLKVADKSVELAVPSSGSPSDTLADGGGIVLKGTSDHTILWNDTGNKWVFSENIEIPALGTYRIGTKPVLVDNGVTIELTSNVTSAPGLSSFGAQTTFTSDNITVNDNTISNNGRATNYVNGDPAHPTDIQIEPLGDILLIGTSKPKIIGLQTTSESAISQTTETSELLSATELSEAASKKYALNLVRTRNLAMTMDVTGPDPTVDSPLTPSEISAILEDIAPVDEYDENTLCRLATVRYYLSHLFLPAPAVTTTTVNIPTYGDVVTDVVVNAINDAPSYADDGITTNLGSPRKYVRRGRIDFQVQMVGLAKAWVAITSLTEDAHPNTLYPDFD